MPLVKCFRRGSQAQCITLALHYHQGLCLLLAHKIIYYLKMNWGIDCFDSWIICIIPCSLELQPGHSGQLPWGLTTLEDLKVPGLMCVNWFVLISLNFGQEYEPIKHRTLRWILPFEDLRWRGWLCWDLVFRLSLFQFCAYMLHICPEDQPKWTKQNVNTKLFNFTDEDLQTAK